MAIAQKHRKSIRLKEYDYSQPGEYFITICSLNHECIFGEIVEEEMKLSPQGMIAEQCWKEIPNHFKNMELDTFVVMPNHVHGIIVLNDYGRDVQLNVPDKELGRDLIYQIPDKGNDTQLIHQIRNDNGRTNVVQQTDVMNHVPTEWGLMINSKQTLGKIVRHFKARASKMIHDAGYETFRWQSRYYDHIIRDDKDLNNIRDYIAGNVFNWKFDSEYVQ
jgi:REP element-mobilizing transposase RayT